MSNTDDLNQTIDKILENPIQSDTNKQVKKQIDKSQKSGSGAHLIRPEYDIELDRKIAETLSSNSNYIIEIEKQLQKLIPYEQECAMQSQKLDELYESNELLMRQLEQSGYENSNQSKTIKHLNDIIHQNDQKIQELESESLRNESDFKDRQNSLQSEQKKLTHDLKDRNRHIDDLQNTIRSKDNQISDLSAGNSAKDLEIDDLSRNLKNEKSEKEKLRKLQVSKMEFEMQQTREIEELTSQVERLKQEQQAHVDRIQSDNTFNHERIISDHTTTLERIKIDQNETIERLKIENNEMQNDIQNFKNKVIILEKETQEMNNINQDLQLALDKSRNEHSLLNSNYESLKYNLKAFIDEQNNQVHKIRKEIVRTEISDDLHSHIGKLKDIESFEDSKQAFHQIMNEINWWYDQVLIFEHNHLAQDRRQLQSRTSKTVVDLEELVRNTKDCIRSGVDLNNSYKLTTLLNDINYNISNMNKQVVEPDSMFPTRGVRSFGDFEQKVRDLLKKNRIMKESAMDGGIKLLQIIEDFLDKNREQFNDLEAANLTMKRRLEELESQSNNFLHLVNKVEHENMNLKRSEDTRNRFSPAHHLNTSQEFTVNKSQRKNTEFGTLNSNPNGNNYDMTRRLEQ